jgi:hypothetical protein
MLKFGAISAHSPQIAGFNTELYISYVILIHNFNKTLDAVDGPPAPHLSICHIYDTGQYNLQTADCRL